MYLIDTNIFLEVLLTQERQEACKEFLEKNIGNLCISDFSLHSIGVILFRNKKEKIFQKFVKDILPNVKIITLSKLSYQNLSDMRRKFGLDFDDAYQYKIAKDSDFKLVTLYRDFEKIKNDLVVMFL
ncbi:MAG: PIN domain-containing protein [Candidatus Methanoperedens sp.]|nr:PIN domain-containing protein [Candidatus Methanoperedens sp.]